MKHPLDPWTDHQTLRVIITGSRDWTNANLISEMLGFVWELNGMVTVVHGDCPTGADRMAREWCERMNGGDQGVVIKEERHPANWEKYGKRAGFVRNKTMAGRGANVCFSFNRNNSTGTAMMVRLCADYGIPVVESAE